MTKSGPMQSISVRMPKPLLTEIKKIARQKGIGYQVLLKAMLAKGVQSELEKMNG